MAKRFGPQRDEPEMDGDQDNLPWLGPAAEDFDDDGDERMIPRSWLIGGLAAFLLLLAGLVAFIYFRVAAPGGSDSLQTAGNVDPASLPLIEADKSPIREKPADPGGMKVDGADLKVLDVASGEQPSEPTTLAQGSETPVMRPTLPPVNEPPAPIPAAATATPPVVPRQPAPAPKAVAQVPAPKPVAKPPAPKPQVAESPPSRGGYYLQLGAFSSRDRADTAWSQANGRFASLSGLSRSVQEAGPTKFRLRAGPVASEDEARRICSELKAQGQACIPAK